jgi:guanine deaminase
VRLGHRAGVVAALAAHGTTTALVFGSHFAGATAALFTAAEQRGLRIFSGLVLSDRLLLPELHQSPDAAYRDSKVLIDRFGSLRYAVMPRFAFSTSEAMLSVRRTLIREDSRLLFTTHINKNSQEIEQVAELFPLGRRLPCHLRALRSDRGALRAGAQRSSGCR